MIVAGMYRVTPKAARLGWSTLMAAALLLPIPALGASVSLAWDAASGAAGYNIYYGTNAGVYDSVVDAGPQTMVQINNLLPGVRHYFAATTYDPIGLESAFSTEISYTPPPEEPLNQQPTLDSIPDTTVNQDCGLRVVQLSGISSGAASEIQTLVVSAFSSQPALVPNPQVTYVSPGTVGTLSFAPAPGAFGSATVTVLVDDGGTANNTLIRSFVITVLPVNYPPTLDPISDVVLDENAGEQRIRLTGISWGGDAAAQLCRLSASSSNSRLIPDPTIAYSGQDNTAMLAFTPVANSFGTASIRVTVDDAQPTNSLFRREFAVRVNQISDTSTNTSPSTQWILWWARNDGVTAQWQMDGTNAVKQTRLNALPASSGWRLAAMGDFGGATGRDLVWQHTNGWAALWLLDGTNVNRQARISVGPAAPNWRLGAVADIDEDGHADILWHHTSGASAAWLMNGTNVSAQMRLPTPPALAGWRMAAAPDINGDGHADILWQQPDGHVTAWLMNGTNFIQQNPINAPAADAGWRLAGTADLEGTRNQDLLWQHDSGALAYWRLEGLNRIRSGRLNPGRVDPAWRVAGPK